jgi:hypothetical protein
MIPEDAPLARPRICPMCHEPTDYRWWPFLDPPGGVKMRDCANRCASTTPPNVYEWRAWAAEHDETPGP